MNKTKYVFVTILFLSFAICFGQNNTAPKEDAKLSKENITDVTSKIEYSQIFTTVGVSAQPLSGMKEYRKKFASSFNTPEVTKDVSASIIIKFVVFEDGSLKDFQIIKEEPSGLGLGKEAIRVLSTSEKWKPGQLNGKNVKQYYTFPIEIKIQGDEEGPKLTEEVKKEELTTTTQKDSIQVQPEPQGGIKKFYMNLQNNIIVPETTIGGTYRTYISFIVEKDGTLSDYKIVRETPSSIGLGEEVIRVLKTFPKWKPGTSRTPYVLPVTTVVENEPEPEPATKKE